MQNSQTLLDTEDERAPAREPSDLAAELTAELRSAPGPKQSGKKRAGAHPKGCQCGNCKWSRPGGSQNKAQEPTPEQQAAANFHLEPDILVPAIYGIGKRITEHYKVTPYQRDEARDISKALAYCIEFLIKLWGMNPAYAPFAFLLILIIFQVGGRVVEYRIMNEETDAKPEPQPAIALTP